MKPPWTKTERMELLLELRPMLYIVGRESTPGYQVLVPGFASRFFSFFTYGMQAKGLALRYRDQCIASRKFRVPRSLGRIPFPLEPKRPTWVRSR